MGETYLTERELCDWLKVSRTKVSSLRKEGMPFVKLGKSVRYDKDKIEKWMEEKSQN